MLGAASVEMFLERGANVVAQDIVGLNQSPQLQTLQKRYGEDRFLFVQGDISVEHEVKDVFRNIEQHFGRLDGLFHNAYKQAAKPIVELSLEEWNAAINGTLTSCFLTNKYAVKLMMNNGGGSIVNTSTIISTPIFRKQNNAAYGAAKAGINQFTRILANEYGEQGIRANVLLPAALSTEEIINNMDAEKVKNSGSRISLGRYGTTKEISQLAAFLLSDESSYVTSSVYHIDGGYGF